MNGQNLADATRTLSGGKANTPDMMSFVWSIPEDFCAQEASNLGVSNVTENAATLTWSGTGTFDYAVGTTNDAEAATITGTVSSNSTVLSLLPSNTYYAFVRTNCGDEAVSPWLPQISFTTWSVADCGNTWYESRKAGQPGAQLVHQ